MKNICKKLFPIVLFYVGLFMFLHATSNAQIGGKASAGGKVSFGASTPVITAGCGNSLLYDQTDCGANATTLYTTIDAAINAGSGGTAVSTCSTLSSPNGRYYLTADLGSDNTAVCLTVDGRRNVQIDLQGHTITGAFLANGNFGSNDGLHVFNGTINCSRSGPTNACVYVDSTGASTDTLSITFHHLTVTNSFSSGTDNVTSTGQPWTVYIDRSSNNVSGQTYYTRVLYNTLSLNGNNYNSVRTGTVQLLGQVAEISNNTITITGGEATSQGAVIYGALVGGSRIHHNQITVGLSLYASSNGSNDRAIAFDNGFGTLTLNNVADYNDVTVNDNRCFRARDTQFPYFHDNYCHGIRAGGSSSDSGSLAAIHLADPDPYTSGSITSIACNASNVCTMTGTGAAHPKPGDILTITSATPSTMQETVVLTTANAAGTIQTYTSSNAANISQTSTGSPLARLADQMNGQISNNTFNVDCSTNKAGLVWAQRGAVGNVFSGNTITTTGTCTSGYTGALFKLYEDGGQNVALVENTVGTSLLGAGNIFIVSTLITSAPTSKIQLCGTAGSQNDANAIWSNISSGPCP